MTEADGSAQPMYPQEARIRNLTYVFLAVIPRFKSFGLTSYS
jgi:hypothetical protein